MRILRLLIKNAFRHRLRTILTIAGLAISVLAFGLMRTVVTSWHSGVGASSKDRLIVRHAVSFFFPLPMSYRDKIANVPGVEKVSRQNWFGGTYINASHFFARWAIDSDTFFDIYPDFQLTDKELSDFKRDRNACVIGSNIAKRYNLKIGDTMILEGESGYPGKWEFIIRGIYRPEYETTDATQMLFHWKYLHERTLRDNPVLADDVHLYVIKIRDTANAVDVSTRLDNMFKNSQAETKTETESAFQQGLLSSYKALLNAIDVMSFVIVGIIMLILANTMAMTTRERTREYAIFRVLGFRSRHLIALIMGESLFIACIGGVIGILLTFPVVKVFASVIPKGILFVIHVAPVTVILAVIAFFLIGIGSSIFPIRRAVGMKIVDGFRFAG
jgi:putative ABC transport system permease protein